MSSSTITVPSHVAERLFRAAKDCGRSPAEHIAALLDDSQRRERFAQLRVSMAQQPPNPDYLDDASHWQSDVWN